MLIEAEIVANISGGLVNLKSLRLVIVSFPECSQVFRPHAWWHTKRCGNDRVFSVDFISIVASSGLSKNFSYIIVVPPYNVAATQSCKFGSSTVLWTLDHSVSVVGAFDDSSLLIRSSVDHAIDICHSGS